MMDLDWPMDAFLRPNHPAPPQSAGSTNPEGPFEFTAGRRQRNGSCHKDEVHMVTEPLYTNLDEQGNSVIHPGFSSWLSALPDPISPIERYQRELQSYPTEVVRLPKRRRDEFEGGDGGKLANAVCVEVRPGTPADGVIQRPDCAKTPGEHVKYIGSFNSGHNDRERPPMVHYSLPRGGGAQRRVAWDKQQQQEIQGHPQRKQPSQEKHTHRKLQKKQPEQLPMDLDSDNDQNNHAQEPPRKLARLDILTRAFSRRSRKSSTASNRPDGPDLERPGTSLGDVFFSLRRRSTFQGGADMSPRRLSLNLNKLTESDRSGTPNGANHRTIHGLSSRLSSMFTPDGPPPMEDDRPRVLGPQDTESGDYRMQIALVGDATVGKSSLIKQFVTAHFDKEYNPTNKDLHLILLPYAGGTSCLLELHDCGGGQEESDISYLAQSWWDAIVICYSIGDSASLSSCTTRWIDDARKNAEGVPVFLAGLKSDRRRPHLELAFIPECKIVSRYDGEEAARAIGAERYLECSAKNCEGIENLFKTVVSSSLPRVIENTRRASDRHHLCKPKVDILYGTGRKIKDFIRTARDERPSTA
ncbi:uncharacterized protein PpBr36_06436 [Pyricularia pennisetigena]|uniref:uncharacterized protein n=1 Tax=Pyricularia pennisetigena TaxID=1578925 RepID=UPI001151D95F|nr:uncharacterized protein PpBr36_06436 [Pyricularia pennisetigena]TLS22677.1 hypothetical protein PpBr36_06436 [Pyricularia pennisetigena]